jgi:hypothetical protein
MSDDIQQNRPLSAEDVLRDLQLDVLTMPEELVLEVLAEHGMEPDDPGPVEHLHALLREHKRASWMAVAEAKKRRGQKLPERSGERLRSRAQQLLDAGHPGLLLAARGRMAEAMTEDELLSIAEDLALAELFEEGSDE